MNGKIQIAIPTLREKAVQNYINALRELGAEGIAVPSPCGAEEFDGLLLPGGVDVAPARYGQEVSEKCGSVDEALDALQFAVTDAFIKAGKPVLGICRGQQLLNVYFGGTLIQHLEQTPCHSSGVSGKDLVHETGAEAESFIGKLYGERFAVNSAHHQAVDRPGRGLRVVQTSDDGVIEALEHETLNVRSVQWHPERMCFAHRREDTVDGRALLAWFVGLCRER